MLKFKRNYQAVFYITDENDKNTEVIIVEPPIAVNFNVERGVSGYNGVFQFYNLSYEVQRKLWTDYQTKVDKTIKMMFYAGYGETESLALISDATVFFCTSQRASGSVDFVTEIQTIANNKTFTSKGFANSTFEAGSQYSDVIQSLIEKTGIKQGYLSEDITTIENSTTYIGNVIDRIKNEFNNYNVFIDNQELNILKDDEYIPTEIPIISEETGLLGTPKLSLYYLELDLMFDPTLKLWQLIYLDTSYSLIQKQLYKIYNIRHAGTISDTSSDKLITSLQLQYLIKENKKAKKPAEIKEDKINSLPTLKGWIKPVNGTVTSKFGLRKAPIKNASTNHKGIDIGCVLNAPVKAPFNGTVSSVGYDQWNGKFIRINHGGGISSVYAHLNEYLVATGQNVSQGDVIAKAGSTGISSGVHLHFAIKVGNNYVNPNEYVRYY